MAHPERFELPTDRFVADYSIQLSYGCRFELPTDRFVADYSIQLSYGCAVLIATAMGSLAERKGFEPSIQLLGRMLP